MIAMVNTQRVRKIDVRINREPTVHCNLYFCVGTQHLAENSNNKHKMIHSHSIRTTSNGNCHPVFRIDLHARGAYTRMPP